MIEGTRVYCHGLNVFKILIKSELFIFMNCVFFKLSKTYKPNMSEAAVILVRTDLKALLKTLML